MRTTTAGSFAALLILMPHLVVLGAASAQPVIIDHTCEALDLIPMSWIQTVQSTMKLHYAHTSHGSQLTTGVERIEDDDPDYDVEIGYCYLPDAPGALCIFDGQEAETYITPELYWESKEGMDYTRAVLNNNPEINTSMWCWCCQLDYYGEGQVQAYLDSMCVLESEFPAVTFVFMTGNAQAEDGDGYNRHQRNEQIRDFCVANDRVLFDFADLDCWWFNPDTEEWEHHTYSYGGTDIPSEHPQFYGDEAGHTTFESCEQKGRALWWMMAVLAGWEGAELEQQTWGGIRGMFGD
ncbi:hypothetical protein JW921_04825 [Candidatus Fermentibacterales bacterium]|nr:hypothetical protein [Candidatus Fermentibacterales bacterium]